MAPLIKRLNRTQKLYSNKQPKRGKKVFANIQYEVPTWNQTYDMLLNQAQKIREDNYKPAIIIGIARGGLIPARVLLDILEIPEFATIQIEFYVDIAQTRREPTLKQGLTTKITDKKALLVDDIADSGKSLKLAKTHLQQLGAKEIKTATLYAKPQSVTTPDYYEKQTSRWVVFPWDAKETLRRIIQKQEGKRTVNHEVAKLVKAGLPKQLAEKLLKDMQ
jgi:hypoxanthine phosphoribosyltransferase